MDGRFFGSQLVEKRGGGVLQEELFYFFLFFGVGGWDLKKPQTVCVTIVHYFRAKLSSYWEVVYMYLRRHCICKLLHKIL